MKIEKTCTFPMEGGCPKPVQARGLCHSHYQNDYLKRRRAAAREANVRICPVDGVSFNDRKSDAIYCSQACNARARTIRETERRQKERGQQGRPGCRNCGDSLEGYPVRSVFCKTQCQWDYGNAQQKKARDKRERPPCDCCGDPLPPKRRRFCSDECKAIMRRAEPLGLTAAELYELLTHDCGIGGNCEWGPKGKQIDHNHETGQLRDILCMAHNTMIGNAKEDIGALRSAIAYLEHWNLQAEADKLASHPNWPEGLDPRTIASLRFFT